jgi:hypothetical protein
MNGSVVLFTETARTVARLSLLCMFLAFAAYTVAYVVLLVRFRLPAWQGPAEFFAGRGRPWYRLLAFCQVCAFATPLLFVIFVAAVDASTVPEYEAFTRIALAASIAFAALSSVYYFIQLALAAGGPEGAEASGLEQILQLNPRAVFTAVNILGWTVFFAVACLCIGPLFLGGAAGSGVVAAFLLMNGVVCVLGMAGYLGRVRALNVLFFNGMGLAVLGFSLAGFLVL